jgi:t-SNARE complex subunit (syntaxin)
MAEHRHIQFLRNEIIDVVENHQEAINNINQQVEKSTSDVGDNTQVVENSVNKETK